MESARVVAEGHGVHADWRLVVVGSRLVAESRSRLFAGDAWRVRAEFASPAELLRGLGGGVESLLSPGGA